MWAIYLHSDTLKKENVKSNHLEMLQGFKHGSFDKESNTVTVITQHLNMDSSDNQRVT